MSSIASYCPDDVSCLIGGLFSIGGFVNGTFITVDKDVLPFTSSRTSDGMVSRTYANDQTYTVTLTLHSGSDSNAVLTKFWQLDEVSGGRGKFPLFIKDKSGSDLFFSTTTWVEKVPTMDKAATIGSRTWVLRSSSAVVNYGGNSEPSGIVNDLLNLATSALPALEGLI